MATQRATRARSGPKYRRITYTTSDGRAGCFQCAGGEGQWFGKNAQGVAARHTDATGHTTWVEAILFIRYTTPERDAAEDAERAAERVAAAGRIGGR